MQGYTRNDLSTRLLYYSGMWEKSNEERNLLSHFRPYHKGFVTLYQILFSFVLFPTSVYYYWGAHVHVVLENTFFTFIATHFLVKSSVYFYWGEPIKKLTFTLEEMYLDYHRDHSVLSRTEQELFDWTKWLVMMSTKYGLSLCTFLHVSYVCLSIFNALQERIIYITLWFPWDETVSPIFEVTLILIGIYLILSFGYLTLTDFFLLTIFLHTYEHLKLLQYNLTNIRELSEGEVGHMTDGRQHGGRKTFIEIIPDHDGTDLEHVQENGIEDIKFETVKRMRNYVEYCEPWRRVQDVNNELKRKDEVNIVMERRLKESIRHHQAIISFVRDLETAYDAYITTQIVINFIPSGCMALWLTLTPHLGVKEVFMFALLIGLYIELGLCCLLSDVIADESSKVREAVYASDWFEASDGFKRSMRIMMCMANQPIVITAAKHIPLSMKTFLSVANMTYSNYMTMLACITGESDLRAKGKVE